MHSISPLLLSTLLLTPILALPSRSTNSYSFPLHQKERRELTADENLAHRIQQHQALKIKYGLNPDEDVERLAKRASVGVSRLAGNDLSYYASISLGTPAQSYEVVLDTGSADLVIALQASNACGQSCTTTAPFYSVAGSSTAKDSKTPVSLTYGTGSASGTVVTDTMSFSGFTGNQAFAACTRVNSLTTSSDQTGLFGLGWQTLSASNSTPFVQALWQTGQLTNPIFAFGLAQLSSSAVPNPTSVVPGGFLTVGDVNTTLFSGTMNWIPLVSQTYWTIPLDNVAVGSTALGITANNAIIDTGTNAIAIPSSAATKIYSQIPGSAPIANSGGLYSYPCSQSVSISLTFGGVAYSMLPTDFNTGYFNRAGTLCVGAISSLGSTNIGSTSQWIVGTPFLMSFYSAYRFNPPAVGLATQANPNNVLQSGPIPTSGNSNSGSLISSNDPNSSLNASSISPSLSTATVTSTALGSSNTGMNLGAGAVLGSAGVSGSGTTSAAGTSGSGAAKNAASGNKIGKTAGVLGAVGAVLVALM